MREHITHVALGMHQDFITATCKRGRCAQATMNHVNRGRLPCKEADRRGVRRVSRDAASFVRSLPNGPTLGTS
jgi:hypothetical protein